MKCVMVINQELPLGLIANTAAVLGMSVGDKIKDIVGEDVADQAGSIHRGITQINISMLRGDTELIRSIRDKIIDAKTEPLFFVDFCDAAQQSKHYDDYKARLKQIPIDELGYLGIAIYGPAQQVNKLTGNIGLLR